MQSSHIIIDSVLCYKFINIILSFAKICCGSQHLTKLQNDVNAANQRHALKQASYDAFTYMFVAGTLLIVRCDVSLVDDRAHCVCRLITPDSKAFGCKI